MIVYVKDAKNGVGVRLLIKQGQILPLGWCDFLCQKNLSKKPTDIHIHVGGTFSKGQPKPTEYGVKHHICHFFI